MSNQGRSSVVWILLAVVSFAVALLAAFGVILSRDTTGRIIYGVLWAAIGFAWLGRYFVAKKRSHA